MYKVDVFSKYEFFDLCNALCERAGKISAGIFQPQFLVFFKAEKMVGKNFYFRRGKAAFAEVYCLKNIAVTVVKGMDQRDADHDLSMDPSGFSYVLQDQSVAATGSFEMLQRIHMFDVEENEIQFFKEGVESLKVEISAAFDRGMDPVDLNFVDEGFKKSVLQGRLAPGEGHSSIGAAKEEEASLQPVKDLVGGFQIPGFVEGLRIAAPGAAERTAGEKDSRAETVSVVD